MPQADPSSTRRARSRCWARGEAWAAGRRASWNMDYARYARPSSSRNGNAPTGSGPGRIESRSDSRDANWKRGAVVIRSCVWNWQALRIAALAAREAYAAGSAAALSSRLSVAVLDATFAAFPRLRERRLGLSFGVSPPPSLCAVFCGCGPGETCSPAAEESDCPSVVVLAPTGKRPVPFLRTFRS